MISGTGTLAVGFLGLQNGGTLAPGITVLYPLAAIEAFPSRDETATMTIDGALTVNPTGRLDIPLIGSGSGQYGRLAVSGAAALDGVLALDFQRGYAPRRGDAFTFLTATGGVRGAFDRVEISGLAPGFQYRLTYSNGQLALEALNDGVPISGPPHHAVFLPLLRRSIHHP